MIRIVILFSLVSLTGLANAQEYRAETEFVYPGEPGFNNEIIAIGNKILTYLDGAQGPGIYAYNTENERMEQLLSTHTGDIDSTNNFQKFYPANGGAIIDDLGRPHWTDGTAAGTVFLEDFGIDSVGGSASATISRVTGGLPSGENLYATQTSQFGERFDGPSEFNSGQLWRLGQSAGQAQLLSDFDRQSLRFISAMEDSAIAFGFDRELGWSFWRITNGSDDLEFLARFPVADPTQRGFSVFSPTITRVGLVFCATGFGPVDGFGSSVNTLWRLSRNGELQRLAEVCKDIEPANQNNSSPVVYLGFNTLI